MSVDEFRAQFADAAGLGEAVPEEVAPVEETETAPPVEEAVEEQQAEEVSALLAGKYKSAEELESAYNALQLKLGEQGAELGQLRALTEEVSSLREAVAPQQPRFDATEIDDYLGANPHQIPALARRALETQDIALYPRVMAAWAEIDSVGAMDFHARAVARAELSTLRAEMAPVLEGMQRRQVSDQFADAFETKAHEHDDFAQVIGSITEDKIAGFPPEILATLETGDQASKERVLETLYRWTKAEQAGNLTEAAQAAVRQSAVDSQAARQDAVVASTSGTSTSREPVSGVDAFRQQFTESDAFRKAAGLT